MKQNKIGIAFLTRQAQQETIDFALELKKAIPNAYVFIFDDGDYQTELSDIQISNVAIQKNDSFFNIVKICDSGLMKGGFYGCNITGNETHIKKQIIAYDKFLFFVIKNYSHTWSPIDFWWVFEDDVFIPSVDTIQNLINKYSESDLVVPNNFRKTDHVMDWHWKHIMDSIDGPYYSSMVCAAGFSQKMIQVVADYQKEKGKFFFIEAMFNTLAMRNNLIVSVAPELKSCVWKGDWHIDEFIKFPNNCFHPMKQIDQYAAYRKAIAQGIKNDIPVSDKIPNVLLEGISGEDRKTFIQESRNKYLQNQIIYKTALMADDAIKDFVKSEEDIKSKYHSEMIAPHLEQKSEEQMQQTAIEMAFDFIDDLIPFRDDFIAKAFNEKQIEFKLLFRTQIENAFDAGVNSVIKNFDKAYSELDGEDYYSSTFYGKIKPPHQLKVYLYGPISNSDDGKNLKKERVIAFAEWLSENEWVKRKSGTTHPNKVGQYYSHKHCEYKTIDELYSIYENL